MSNTPIKTTTPSLTFLSQYQLEAAVPETMNDIVTIAEARERLGKHAPTRDAFHKAVNRGKLNKQPQQADDTYVRFRMGDIHEYMKRGGFKKSGCFQEEHINGSSSRNGTDAAPPESLPAMPELVQPSPPSTMPEIGSGVGSAISQVTACDETAPFDPLPALEQADLDYLAEREAIVDSGVKSWIAATKALFDIKTYRNGLLWKKSFRTFSQYLRVKWGYQKSQGYHLVNVGGFIAELVCGDSANAENSSPKLPVSEGQVRPLVTTLPKEHQVECWNAITATKDPATLTAKDVALEVKKFASEKGLETKPDKPVITSHTQLLQLSHKLKQARALASKLPEARLFEELLLQLEQLAEKSLAQEAIEVSVTPVETIA